jgi:hypothetical protein
MKNVKFYSGKVILKANKLIFDKYNNLFAGKGNLIEFNVDEQMFTNLSCENYTTFDTLEPDANDFELIEGEVIIVLDDKKCAEPDNVKDNVDKYTLIDKAVDEIDQKLQKIEETYDQVADTISDKEAWEEKIANADIKFNDGQDYDIDYSGYSNTLDLADIKLDKDTLQVFVDHYPTVIDKIRENLNKKNLEVVDPEYVGASNDAVNHPAHYTWLKDKCGVEPIEIIRHMDFSLGNAFKYLLRAGYKRQEGISMPDAIKQDLRKAIWYIEDKINNL